MRITAICISGLLGMACSADPGEGEIPSAGEIIDRAIAFHDPKDQWATYAGTITFTESRPGDPDRHTQIWLDNSKAFFRLNRNDTDIHGMVADSCFVERGEAECVLAETMRNYYTYLWGLPMKLRDPGVSPLPEAEVITRNGQKMYVVTMPYEKDTWHFYFSAETYELLAYSFVKKDGSGEYIIADGTWEAEGIRMPDKRSWYSLDSTFLGTDRIVKSEAF